MKKNIEQLERAKELRFNNHFDTFRKIGDELGITRQKGAPVIRKYRK